ncbi:MAG: GGDEF domain-containing protein [Lachnospiraceae bacterium]|nr:GGDEF domain-containing protein [Lachnospiraceae bacterium]
MEKKFTIQNAEWYFHLSPIKQWYQYPLTWFLVLVAVLVSFLASSLVLYNYDLRSTRKELEEMIVNDPLTGVLNRRGLFHYLNTLTIDPDEKFLLSYVDLNHFKHINDTYGHIVGDQSLLQFSRAVLENVEKTEYTFARIGGDEFVLIMNRISDTSAADVFWESVSKSLTSTSLPFELTFSVGTALYPEESRSIDDLIHIADRRMYEMKEKFETREKNE